jgi:hypothetical protein
MSGARLSYDLLVVGDGILARLTACLVAKTGKRVMRLRRHDGPAPALPPFPPLDLTMLPAVRETALKLGILVPLRDRLRAQHSLGHFCSPTGSAEVFLERAARDHQQNRLQHADFENWARQLAEPMSDPVPTEYPAFFHKGWWRRWRNKVGWSELNLGGTEAKIDALSRPYFLHPWTASSSDQAHLRWNGQRDLQVLDRPLQSFLELAEARAGVELLTREHAQDYDIHRGRLVSVITNRGRHIGSDAVIWADPIESIDIGNDRLLVKLNQRWKRDGEVSTTMRRLYGRLAAVDWPPFLSGPILTARGKFQIHVEARGHEVLLETWLREGEDESLVRQFFAQHFPLLKRYPLTETQDFTFVRRQDPAQLPPKLNSGIGSLFVLPDRLIHGLGLDAPFAMAQQAAERLLEQ